MNERDQRLAEARADERVRHLTARRSVIREEEIRETERLRMTERSDLVERKDITGFASDCLI